MEEDRLYSMDLTGGKAELLLKIAEGVRGDISFDLRASSLHWSSERGEGNSGSGGITYNCVKCMPAQICY